MNWMPTLSDLLNADTTVPCTRHDFGMDILAELSGNAPTDTSNSEGNRISCFPSGRRHTRCLSDWSSDVCSSDLENEAYGDLIGNAAAPNVNQLAQTYGL